MGEIRFNLRLITIILTFACLSTPAVAHGRDLVLTSTHSPVPGERRLALVIGNAAYAGDGVQPLKNPIHDADAMASTLQHLGFTVTEVLDADRDDIRDAVHKFARAIDKSPQNVVALLYYSGHGLQVSGQNYLVPIGFTMPDDPEDIADYAYPVQKGLGEMQAANARVNIVILDACRSNPYDSSKGIGGKGLVKMEASGVYIAYATAEGKTADDNPNGENGLYTSQLLRALKTPGLDVHQVFQLARRGVWEASEHEQYPYDYDGLLSDDFYFDGNSHGQRPSTVVSAGDRVKLDSKLIDLLYEATQGTKVTAGQVQALLDAGADVNARDSDDDNDMTALEWAAWAGNSDVVYALLDAGAAVNAKDKVGETALMTAVRYDKPDIVKALIDAGADVNAEEDSDHENLTAIMYAAMSESDDSNMAEIIKALVGAGANLNAGDKDGEPPLQMACVLDFAGIVQDLIDAGADVKAQEADGSTALMTAAQFGSAGTVKALLGAGADKEIKNKDGETALLVAATSGRLEVVKLLIASGADINAKSTDGSTALIAAVAGGQPGVAQVVKALVDAGEPVDGVNNDGATALMFACQYDGIDVVRELIAAGANVNAKDSYELTPLLWAMSNGQSTGIDVVKALIAAGADVNARGSNGKDALQTLDSGTTDPTPNATTRAAMIDALKAAGATD